MTTELATRGSLSTNIEQVLIGGDLAQLKPEERLNYYNTLCTSLGLNPLTQPFQYIVLNSKLQLYAKKDCTEQLRKIHGVSITNVDPKQIGDLLVVVASASDRDGRVDSSTGAVNLSGLKGENLANAMMKAETKAKRRVTLSLCGLGMLDETEVQTLREQGAAQEPQGNNWEAPAGAISHEPAGASAQPQTTQSPNQQPAASRQASQPPARPTTTQQSGQQAHQRQESAPAAAQPQVGQCRFIPPNGLTTVIKAVKEITPIPARAATGTLPAMKGVRARLIVTFVGTRSGVSEASCFDTKFWPVLKDSVGLECHLQIAEKDSGGKHYINIEDVLYRDGQEVTFTAEGQMLLDGQPPE